MSTASPPPTLALDYCGEIYHIDPAHTLTIGRQGDIHLDDDNLFLHRQFLEIRVRQGLWWLHNIGTRLTAAVTDDLGMMQAWLAPGASLPLTFAHTIVWFTAGPTTYEFDIIIERVTDEMIKAQPIEDGSATVGAILLTPDQKLLLVGLCEGVLHRGPSARTVIPPSADVAERLGWTVTKFNRKLDNVCQKLTAMGVRGLHGDSVQLASNRRARLVEYAVAARLVDKNDLQLLP